VAALTARTELAHPAQATTVQMEITVWDAAAPMLANELHVRLAARLDTITVDAMQAAMELARHAQATPTALGSTT